jgi:quercetin dioxygenase-like cupin family protein
MPQTDVRLRVADGETIAAQERREVVLLVEREELTITWSRYAAGEHGTDLHVHREHTDAFYILEGELSFALGPAGERIYAGAGSFVAVPPNVVHGFSNRSDGEVRWLNLHAPDKGFANYLRGLRDGTGAAFDSFDPPADGGLSPAAVIVSGPGEGERLASGVLLKAVLPELCVVEWPPDGPDPETAAAGGVRHTFVHEIAVVDAHAPDGGFADMLRALA